MAITSGSLPLNTFIGSGFSYDDEWTERRRPPVYTSNVTFGYTDYEDYQEAVAEDFEPEETFTEVSSDMDEPIKLKRKIDV